MPIKPAISQTHPFFAKTPPALQTEILSYLPWTEVTAIRGLCQEFQGVVAGFEGHYASPRIAFHMNRLQNIIDTRNNAGLPTDAKTLLASLRIWTSTRGSFKNPNASIKSLEKWFSHLAGGQLKSQRPEPYALFETWSFVAMQAVCLQLKARASRNHPGSILMVRSHPLWADFQRCLTHIDNIPLSMAEQEELFHSIISAQVAAERDIMNPFHGRRKEHPTFPETQLDHYRLTPIRAEVGNGQTGRGKLRGPSLPAGVMCDYMTLPALPNFNTFCYYSKEEWATKMLKKWYRRYPHGKEMCPLMKARVLEGVDIF